MNTSCTSQKTIKKVLRSRRISIPMKPKNVEPKKALQKPSMKRTITKGKLDDDQKEFIAKNLSSRKELNQFTGVNTAKSKKSFSLNESDKSIGDDGACSMPKQRKSSCNVNEKSKIGKSDTKITTKPTDVGVTSKQHDKNLEIGEQSESEESLISNSNKLEDDSQKLLVLGHYDEREHQSREQDEKIMKEVDQIEEGNQCDELRDMVENQTDAEDEDDDVENCEGMNSETESDTKSLSGDCLDGILSGFNKDIGTLYSKTDRIESDVKEIRRLLEVQQNKPCSYRSLSSRLKEESATSLLPKIPLGKKSFVRKMESDAGENDEYKKQMIKKLASYGGKSVPEVVINIFKKLFTPKLKTKYCWVGSSQGAGKKAFKNFPNITEIIWMSVKVHFESCTEVTIIKEIKNRFNQADKDYERQMQKLTAVE